MKRRLLAVLIVLALTSGCGVNRYVDTPTDELTLAATSDVNPNREGRASPVAVRVYQLTDRTTLDTLDFDGAFSNAEELLGGELKGAEEFMLRPGESKRHEMELASGSKHIAVVAAYRDIDGARWKLVYDVNPNWYSDHRVTLTNDGLVLGKPDEGE